eukprot:maker-scaffold_19-snap-gene-2.43-mRNA-1 protein AED:0.00 eAED:0.00 QI:155/1/1/1/1/1/2/1040/140
MKSLSQSQKIPTLDITESELTKIFTSAPSSTPKNSKNSRRKQKKKKQVINMQNVTLMTRNGLIESNSSVFSSASSSSQPDPEKSATYKTPPTKQRKNRSANKERSYHKNTKGPQFAWSKFQSSPDPKELPMPSFLNLNKE